jgi:hypothetical protein
MFAQQLEEAKLEIAERDLGAERATKLRDPLLVRIALDARLEVRVRRPVTMPRLVAGPGEDGRLQARREVQQRARRLVIGMPYRSDVSRTQRVHPVDDDPGSPAGCGRGHRDLRSGRRAREQLQQVAAGEEQ